MQGEQLDACDADVIIVGGGLGGLAAAALAAREGRSVIVLEQAGELGGRATTQVRQGVHWNLGAHALYCRGRAFQLFRELGVPFTGRFPSSSHGVLVAANGHYPLPTGAASLLRSKLFTIGERWRALRLLAGLGRIDARRLDGFTARLWIERAAGTGNLGRFMSALLRLSTYASDLDRLSAGAAVDQLRLGLKGNVWYLDGGWQTLVDGLRNRAAEHNAQVRTHGRASAVQPAENHVRVQLATGEVLTGRAVIVTADPKRTCELLQCGNENSLGRWTAGCIPVKAACLDLALDGLTRPDRPFALGLDCPLYASVHSASAKLAPEGVAVVHVMKYLDGAEIEPAEAVERELEEFLEVLQPGWKARVLARRFLPSMTVAHSLPRADEHGLLERPPVALAERPNIFLAGDWVGPDGMLADAAAASASAAAARVLELLSRRPAVAPRRAQHVAG
jgi:phytoene dehydrogenase-like protein